LVTGFVHVSIQLVSPASGDSYFQRQGGCLPHLVSIQLVSPASGDFLTLLSTLARLDTSFHSISFPSEWGRGSHTRGQTDFCRFHSISFPSEWGLQPPTRDRDLDIQCFHSISFPSEWGHGKGRSFGNGPFVSIQLVSPASGDRLGATNPRSLPAVSIQLVSPASGDAVEDGCPFSASSFPFN